MHALIQTVAFRGIDTIPVNIQVYIANGLPAIAVVGLADRAVAESRERVRAALSSIGLALPPKRIAVNLAPADVLKEDAHFDFPIVLGLLVAMGVVPKDAVEIMWCWASWRLMAPFRRYRVFGSGNRRCRRRTASDLSSRLWC
jgi:magnesium chelatase family protein